MGILEEVRQEQEAIKRLLERTLMNQQEILSRLPEMKDPLLTKKEILSRLGKSSETAFRNRTPMLVKLGMRKEGRTWVINESQFKKYINHE